MNPTPTNNAPKRITVTAECYRCGAIKRVTGNAQTWLRWREGQVTSDVAFRALDPDTRRWLINGICPDHNL